MPEPMGPWRTGRPRWRGRGRPQFWSYSAGPTVSLSWKWAGPPLPGAEYEVTEPSATRGVRSRKPTFCVQDQECTCHLLSPEALWSSVFNLTPQALSLSLPWLWKREKKKELSWDQCQHVKCNGVQGGWRAFGHLVAPFIKKKKMFFKAQSDQHQGGPVKMHRAVPSLNDFTCRISLQGNRSWGHIIILLGRGKRRERELKGAKGSYLCFKPEMCFPNHEILCWNREGGKVNMYNCNIYIKAVNTPLHSLAALLLVPVTEPSAF